MATAVAIKKVREITLIADCNGALILSQNPTLSHPRTTSLTLQRHIDTRRWGRFALLWISNNRPSLYCNGAFESEHLFWFKCPEPPKSIMMDDGTELRFYWDHSEQPKGRCVVCWVRSLRTALYVRHRSSLSWKCGENSCLLLLPWIVLMPSDGVGTRGKWVGGCGK